MKLEHLTGMEAGYTMGRKPDGRELLLVCVKGTFAIPENGGEPRLADEQVPLVEADTFTGEPGFSSTLYESDYAPHKPKCDILLNGSAYGPNGEFYEKVPVALQIGSFSKSFNVVGRRVWEKGMLSVRPSDIEPFRVMPFSYDNAFGGVDKSHKDPAKIETYPTNPAGVGFNYHLYSDYLEGKPLPNTEEINKPVKKPDGDYKPMSFGAVGRSWKHRVPLAGTYDQNWMDNIFPFLPPDFNEAYHQSAPVDQQIPHPSGGERVILNNLTPAGRTEFRLPKICLLAWFFMKNGEEEARKMVMDTVLIEPDAGRFMVTCRASLPLRKNMFEVEMVVLGEDLDERDKVLNEPTFDELETVEDESI